MPPPDGGRGPDAPAHLELSGTLGGLERLEVSDLQRYKRAVASGEQLGFSYYFPYLLARNRGQRRVLLIGEDDGSICLYIWGRDAAAPRLDLVVAPTPLRLPVLERCLERANDFNGDRSARVLRLDARDAETAASLPQLRVRARRSQYLYRPGAFADLGGRAFRTLRRNVVRVEKLPGLQVTPYAARHAGACHQLLRHWRQQHRAAHGTTGGVATTRRFIDQVDAFSEPDVRGELVWLDGRLVAFAFGGELRPGVGCFFDAKSDAGVPGLSYFQRHSFLSKLEGFELVNDGSDLGRDGLRQLKQSLRPAGMQTEFRASQRGA